MTYELSSDRAREAVQTHTRRLAEAARTAGPDAPVPTAPRWTAADLVEHMGHTQQWVAEILERRITDPAELPTETQFWLHSLLNEAVVHGFDAHATAAGSADTFDLDADVAAELITNHLAMLTSPTWAMMRADSAEAIRGDGEVLRWHAMDGGLDATGDWFVTRRPDGATWQHDGDAADVIVHGPAASLLLVLTRRLPVGDAHDVTIEGDAALVDHWVENTAHIAD